ncbi:hypothetical protein [Mobiluncus curtisii]|uniref:hypothetical protein n=1 Tax=Mobiluncus curtisii TaxID=2051 RepID=UPI002092857D|nr:hypothetical protein [Mobiluncus curtisii]
MAEVVGLGVMGAFIVEMLRRPRTDLLSSVAGNVTGILIVSTAGAWVMLERKHCGISCWCPARSLSSGDASAWR